MPSRTPARDPRAARAPRASVQAAAVFAIAVAVFAPGLGGPWLFDDHPLILENPFVHGLGQWHRWLGGAFWDTSSVSAATGDGRHFWRPLVLASYALDWTLGGGSPVVFHATNLLLHGLVAVLGYFTLRRWVGAGWPAWLAALAWAVHPTKAESVAWISGRPDLLVTLGALVALVGLRARLDRRAWGLPVELFGAVVAYSSKEHAVVLPLLAAVEAVAHAGWPRLRGVDRGNLGRAVAPELILLLGYLVARQRLLPIVLAEGGAWPAFDARVLTVLETYGRFALLTVWPADLSFGGSLLRFGEAGRMVDVGFVLGGAAYLTALMAIAWRWRSRLDAVAAVALSVLLLVPVSNAAVVVNIVMASPRLLYLPLLGPALLAGIGLGVAPPTRRYALALGLTATAALAVRGAVRAGDFADARQFWTYEVAHNPRYLPALEFFVIDELSAARPRSALKLAVRGFRGAAGTAGQSGAAAILKHAFEALLLVTPDVDRATLSALDRFVTDLREGRPATFTTRDGDLELAIPPHSDAARELRRDPMALAALQARLASRLDDDARALALTREVAARCPDCGEQRVLVPVAARAEAFGLARVMVANLQRTQGVGAVTDVVGYLAEAERRHELARRAPPMAQTPLRAWFFAGVGAWGRAYAVARPALRDPTLTRSDGVKLAELAFRAGDVAAARRQLSRWESREAVEELTRDWAHDMRWIDAARPPGDALPAVLTDTTAAR